MRAGCRPRIAAAIGEVRSRPVWRIMVPPDAVVRV
jgi:hypothetical protein